MSRNELIEAVARKMAGAEGLDPDQKLYGARGYPMAVGDYMAYRMDTFDAQEMKAWQCFRGRAETAVDLVTEAAK